MINKSTIEKTKILKNAIDFLTNGEGDIMNEIDNAAVVSNKVIYKTDEHDTQLINSILKAYEDRVNLSSDAVLVTTKVENLYEQFLDQLDPIEKAGYQCNACRRFVDNYGNLVALYANGTKVPVCWNPETVPTKFRKAVAFIKKVVEKTQIDSVFFSTDKTWGIPKTGEWTHFNIIPKKKYAPKSVLLTPFQASAEKKEDYKILCRSIGEFKVDVVKQAHSLLSNDNLYRSEKVLGVAEWFLKLLNKLDNTTNRSEKENFIWYAVATAPPGFCHIRTTMIGTLLEDLVSGLNFDDASKKFAAKMNPLQYQRPTAPLSGGQIDAAEKLVEKLGIANSLKRRYARLDDIKKLWEPKVVVKKEAASGVFGHLRNNKKEEVQTSIAPATVMTWEKFRKSVLPNAEKMEVYTGYERLPFYAFVTAEDMESPPIIQWDELENRNPVTWYTSHMGSTAAEWNLNPNKYQEVTALSLFPFMWADEDKYRHQEKGVLFVLKDCKDKRTGGKGGGGLFPEHLKSDLHQIRSVVETNTRSSVITGLDEASASGIAFRGKETQVKIRVTANGMVTEYKLDRWD